MRWVYCRETPLSLRFQWDGSRLFRLHIQRAQRLGLSLLVGVLSPIAVVLASENLPQCHSRGPGGSMEGVVMGASPTTSELLSRLAYAEARSTGFPEDPLVYEGIAWGVMNRVRLGEASRKMRRQFGEGVAGVIFRKGQFNPAVSPRSAFANDFLCPRDGARWRLAVAAATKALLGNGNPFIQTEWERTRGLSLMVNFYYPASTQARGPLAPWEGSADLEFLGPVRFEGGVVTPDRVRFYRLTHPPADILTHR